MAKRYKVCFFMIHPAHYHNAVIKHILEDERIDAHVMFYLEHSHDHKEWKSSNEKLDKVYFCRKKIDIIRGEFYNPDAIRYFLANSFDLVVISGRMPFTSYILLKLCKLKRIPYIFSTDLSLMPINSNVLLSKDRHWKIYRKIANLSEGIWVPGEASVNYWVNAIGRDVENRIIQGRYLLDKESVIVNGDRATIRNKIRHDLGIGRDEFVILFVGQLIKSRNIQALLQAHELLMGKGIDTRVIVIGYGENEEVVKKYVEKHDQKVIHIRSVTYAELNDYYQASDCYVHPGKEPYSLAVVQAVFNKIPVITTSMVGAAYDYIQDQKNGYIVEYGNYKKIADALRDVIEGKIDKNEVAAIADSVFEKRSATNVANEVVNYVLKTLS